MCARNWDDILIIQRTKKSELFSFIRFWLSIHIPHFSLNENETNRIRFRYLNNLLCTLTSSLAGPLCNPNRTFEYFFMNTRHTTYAMISFLSLRFIFFVNFLSVLAQLFCIIIHFQWAHRWVLIKWIIGTVRLYIYQFRFFFFHSTNRSPYTQCHTDFKVHMKSQNTQITLRLTAWPIMEWSTNVENAWRRSNETIYVFI